ncbi:hypothetical protein Rs2_23248 [Raphanus sativus]|nr:hypothetical protein Rs2_23248 [Raphanus sativus]
MSSSWVLSKRKGVVVPGRVAHIQPCIAYPTISLDSLFPYTLPQSIYSRLLPSRDKIYRPVICGCRIISWDSFHPTAVIRTRGEIVEDNHNHRKALTWDGDVRPWVNI